jgi:DNA polymerase I
MTGTLLLVDGHSLAYRAFYALREANLVTTTGQHTEGVYGFTSMLINTLRDEQPTHVVVAFDVSRRSFRNDQYADYKAGRSESPADFAGQVDLIKEVLAALRIAVVEAPGYEADDVIATLVRAGEGAGMKVLVTTGDRDTFQLVGDGVTVLYAIRGVSELARMDPAAVTTKYGVGPDRYRDLAALVGESSDNLSGVPGVGPKTAAKWIAQYGSLDGIVEHADEIKGKAGDSLRAHLADVLRNHQLNRLVDDLELSLGVEQARWEGWDREAAHLVFDTLEFRGELRERALKVFGESIATAESGFELAESILGVGEVAG